MRTFIFATLLILSLSAVTASKSIALPIDFIDHGNYTTDTISDLDWLDVTETVGMSYNSVQAQFGSGGVYEGWRYATINDLTTMLSNWVGAPIPAFNVSLEFPQGSSEGLINLLGATETHLGSGEISIQTEGLLDYNPFIDPVSGISTHLSVYIQYEFLAPDVEYSGLTEGFERDDNVGDRFNRSGSFLIRDAQVSAVPLPGAAWLFTAALSGLGWLSRKKWLDTNHSK